MSFRWVFGFMIVDVVLIGATALMIPPNGFEQEPVAILAPEEIEAKCSPPNFDDCGFSDDRAIRPTPHPPPPAFHIRDMMPETTDLLLPDTINLMARMRLQFPQQPPQRGSYEIQPLVRVWAEYPLSAQEQGLEETVVVNFDVTPRGTVINAEIWTSTNQAFNQSALQAIVRFRYQPKIENGVPVIRENVKYTFEYHPY